MQSSQAAPGVVGPFAGLDVPWLLRMRAESRRNHPFLIWAPFEAPARSWSQILREHARQEGPPA